MKKVITYGTYDHLHEGHINLLKRAKQLGDYLIVGVTTENFDINRGKINVEQSLMERIEAVKALGIADEVFPEEYFGQKIDDIKRYNIDIFTVGSDWEGHFDYLKEYCEVIYLPRTEGISSTEIRESKKLRIGAYGTDLTINKFYYNSKYVNGLTFTGVFFDEKPYFDYPNIFIFSNLNEFIKNNDIIYISARPEKRFEIIKKFLSLGKHVISESPISLNKNETIELYKLSEKNNVLLFDSIKTAFLLSFSRMILLIKSGVIGEVKSIDSTCTSLEVNEWLKQTNFYNSYTGWGSIGLLPALYLLGSNYRSINSYKLSTNEMKDSFTKIDLIYDNAIATVNLGIGVKSEGDLRISGTKGYVYVPSPWWKSEYFEVRFENPKDNKPFYYQSEGEGIRMELVHMVQCIKNHSSNYYVDKQISLAISEIISRL